MARKKKSTRRPKSQRRAGTKRRLSAKQKRVLARGRKRLAEMRRAGIKTRRGSMKRRALVARGRRRGRRAGFKVTRREQRAANLQGASVAELQNAYNESKRVYHELGDALHTARGGND